MGGKSVTFAIGTVQYAEDRVMNGESRVSRQEAVLRFLPRLEIMTGKEEVRTHI